jgi:hypothetical protein
VEVSLNLELIARAMLSGVALLFALVVCVQRARWRRSQRRGRRLRFYPTNMMIGLALQNIQVFAHPEIDHMIQERYADAAAEDDEGDPDDPQKALARQLRRIRNGERVDSLLVPSLQPLDDDKESVSTATGQAHEAPPAL